MQISVSGQHVAIGKSLQDYARSRVSEVVTKYFENASTSNIHFTKRNYEFTCDILAHEGSGRAIVLKSSATSDEIHASFDLALAKLEKQLRKYKSKLKDRGNRVKISQIDTGIKYIISPIKYPDEESTNASMENPLIIAEKPLEILTLSVEEAVMKMDLEDLPALMFRNTKNDRINVVYYRKDGNISWVDTSPKAN